MEPQVPLRVLILILLLLSKMKRNMQCRIIIISCSELALLLLLYYESINIDYIPATSRQEAEDGNKLSLE